MDRSSTSRIEEWDSRTVTGGYVGLNELADADFTGVVESGGTRLLMLNGRVVGVFDGQISAFEDGDATAYESPDPSLPLLFAMQEFGGEVRGQYYTDDTPIREVDETLTSGGFTGYLELSENVLSGDYYVIYYGGRSLSAAFVGNEGRVVTGEEAMDLAAEEVGIYEVRSVDLEVYDVPEPPEEASTTAAATGSSEDASGEAEGASDDEAHEAGDEADDDGDEGAEDERGSDSGDATASEDEESAETGAEAGEVETAEDGADAANEATASSHDESESTATTDVPPDDDGQRNDEPVIREAEDGDERENEDEPADAVEVNGNEGPTRESPGPSSTADAVEGRTESAANRSASRRPEPEQGEPDERFEEEARWREARTVPALDPEESEQIVDGQPVAADPDRGDDHETRPGADEAPGEMEAVEERVERLESELEASERQRRRLTERLEEVVTDRDEIRAERAALAERIESLEARIEEAESAATVTSPEGEPTTEAPDEYDSPGSAVDPETALNQTDLFVRYGSKGKATLSTAHDGQAGADEVAENLRIETHSRFDVSTATVGGQAFDSYLEGTIQYRFLAWLIEELLYEIQGTGTEAGLRDLYDVLPNVDRAEFNGTVTRRDEEDEERRETFDVVCRDRMGKPLVVANINDSLDPATGEMMARLVEDATSIAESHESVGAAFLVTASFFEPDALETAAEATRSGGFLSRDSKKSFVRLARNGGYHLCLVEARGDDFHVAVPEF